MTMDKVSARADWAARVSKQAEQMRIIAGATDDAAMRDELMDYAAQLQRHAAEIRAGG